MEYTGSLESLQMAIYAILPCRRNIANYVKKSQLRINGEYATLRHNTDTLRGNDSQSEMHLHYLPHFAFFQPPTTDACMPQASA